MESLIIENIATNNFEVNLTFIILLSISVFANKQISRTSYNYGMVDLVYSSELVLYVPLKKEIKAFL